MLKTAERFYAQDVEPLSSMNMFHDLPRCWKCCFILTGMSLLFVLHSLWCPASVYRSVFLRTFKQDEHLIIFSQHC